MKKFEEQTIDKFLKGKKIDGTIKKEFSLIPKRNKEEASLNLERVKSKRADLLIENKNRIEIYEVKTKLNADALGKLIIYKYLYNQNFQVPNDDKRPIILRVLCEETDPEIEPIFKLFGIDVIVVS